jgi:type I restriction enzyme, S subunit
MEKLSNKNQLPKNWKWVKLGEVGRIETGTTPSKGNSEYYGNEIPFFKPTDLRQGINTILASDNLSKLGFVKTRRLPKNSILVTCVGATIGKTGLIKVEGASNQQINSIIPEEEYNPKFVFYQIISHSFQNQIKDNASSTTLPILNKSKFQQLNFITTRKDFQNSIVSKIEELFSELDKGIENLRIAQQQLKTYRQSILKWAFEGKLTNEKVKEGELPKGWKLQKLNDIGGWKGGGTPSKANKAFWQNGNILWVSPKDMKSKVIHDTIDKITSDAIENSSTNLISRGSILFVVRSGILRRTLPVAITICDVTVNQDLQAFTPKGVLPNYVYWYVQAKNEEIRRDCSKDGTTVESIESSLLKNYLIPICSGEEQHNIVQAIESRLSVADKMEEGIIQSMQQTEVLRQSILKKAFEGKLV